MNRDHSTVVVKNVVVVKNCARNPQEFAKPGRLFLVNGLGVKNSFTHN